MSVWNSVQHGIQAYNHNDIHSPTYQFAHKTTISTWQSDQRELPDHLGTGTDPHPVSLWTLAGVCSLFNIHLNMSRRLALRWPYTLFASIAVVLIGTTIIMNHDHVLNLDTSQLQLCTAPTASRLAEEKPKQLTPHMSLPYFRFHFISLDSSTCPRHYPTIY